MNTETLDRLEALLAKASVKPLLLGANPYQDAADMRAHKRRIEELRREAMNALPELLSIARRAADVEGICRIAHDTFENDDDSGGEVRSTVVERVNVRGGDQLFDVVHARNTFGFVFGSRQSR